MISSADSREDVWSFPVLRVVVNRANAQWLPLNQLGFRDLCKQLGFLVAPVFFLRGVLKL